MPSLIKNASKEIAHKLLEDEMDLKAISYAVDNETEWEKIRESIFTKVDKLLGDFIKAKNSELAYRNKTDFRRAVFINLRPTLRTEAAKEYKKEIKGDVSFDFPEKNEAERTAHRHTSGGLYTPPEKEGPEIVRTGPNEFTEIKLK